MQDPAKMKNKSVVLDAICNAQLHFNEEPTMPSPKLSREALESLLMVYVKRFREAKNAFTTLDCTYCGTTGIYAPNGGPCFRCKGKGFQDEADQKRNYGYDLHHRPAAVAQPTELEKAQDEVTQRLTGKSELYDEDDIPF